MGANAGLSTALRTAVVKRPTRDGSEASIAAGHPTGVSAASPAGGVRVFSHMRILFCLGGPSHICGPNVWLTRHLPLLRAQGIEPRILYIAHNPDEPCTFRAALEASGVGSRAVRLSRYVDDDVMTILEALAIEQPDIFVPNYSIPAYYATSFAREAGIRTVGILHSDDPYYHDILDLFVSGPEPARLDALVSVSAYLHELALRTATPTTRVVHATYGVPIDGACAAPPDDTLTLLYAGRLVEWQKRIMRLTHRLCDATLAVPGVRAVLYGEGPNRDDVERIIAERGATHVRVAGGLGHEDVMPAMRQGHALVLLSDFEGLAIALTEAMACGVVPIVAQMRSGTSDVIAHDVNALVVDPDDEASVVNAVRRLREEPGLWARLSAAARATIVSRGLTAEDCARRWADLCRQLAPRTRVDRVRIPAPDTLELPPRCTRPFGFGAFEHRHPRSFLRRAIATSRPIYVWGAGAGGRKFLASETAQARTVAGVIDRRATNSHDRLDGAPLYPPGHLAAEIEKSARPFVVIASIHHAEIGGELEKMGFLPDQDFICA
jgi:colanic acid/amylovoran biosynthesis glycosyltransferase